MKQLIVLTALLAFTGGPALAAGPAVPAKATASPASGFEVRVSAPGPDALADQMLQEAIDQVASTGGGVHGNVEFFGKRTVSTMVSRQVVVRGNLSTRERPSAPSLKNGEKQLFVDSVMIREKQGITRVIHPAKKLEQPVLRASSLSNTYLVRSIL